MNAPTGYGPPPAYGPPPRRPSEIAFGVVSGLLILGAGVVNAGLLFVMCFLPDGCGSSSTTLSKRFCDGTGYLEVLAAPWISLVTALLVAGLVALPARRHGRTPWSALLPAVLIHAAGLAFVYFFIAG
ncbi:hypothetical protein GCM10010441_69480 [Kitasatospora paracochleata]|uniref:Integral membrane protein n=1 Tax=Kitasatospora paracochleata TaxID=58354 RepID=A0ABT1JAA7_9ACTN|nr:hypothetical protein [Kitasatospora paracochleata]MCP2314391.1 hypothetical protein [Kitasatospora paracochleata]